MRRLQSLVVWMAACTPSWRGAARVTEGLAVSSLACDGGTTQQYLSESTWQESNPILGHHPSRGTVWAYLGGIAIAVVGANRVIPPKLALALNVLVMGVEVESIAVNMHVGSSACGVGDGGPWLDTPISKKRRH